MRFGGAAAGAACFAALVGGEEAGAGDLDVERYAFTEAEGNETHHIWVQQTGETYTPMVASTQMPVRDRLARWRPQLNDRIPDGNQRSVVAGKIDEADRAIRPTVSTIQDGTYPLSRNLYLYVNLPPGETLPPAEQAFIELIFSDEGQQIVRAAGFVPLPQALRQPPLLAP